MPSGEVSLWVPIVVGVLGLCGVLGAQLIAGWREDRRWQRETRREDLRWQREDLRWQRQRAQSRDERRYAGREEAYGRMIGLLEGWQWVLHPAKERVIKGGGSLDEPLRQALEAVRDQTREALGPMNLHAPDDIRHLMRDAVVSKAQLTEALLTGNHDRAAMNKLYRQSLDNYYSMRTAMRLDLGIDPDTALDADLNPNAEPKAEPKADPATRAGQD